MSEQWRPANAPQLTREFRRRMPPPVRTPVSKSEIERLERERRKLTPQLQLAPSGPIRTAVDRQAAHRLAVRIGQQRGRLSREKGNARAAFGRSR